MAIIFDRPATPPRVLPTAPVLESWEKLGHPDQRRLGAYLDEVQALVSSAFPDAGDHLVLELMVGMPVELADASGGRDLDNYLLPIARRLGTRRLDAVFGRKGHGPTSAIALAPASQTAASPGPPQLSVRVTGSSESRAWKQQIHDACRAAVRDPLPPGPVALRICFSVSSRRNWSNLWKPAIDALARCSVFNICASHSGPMTIGSPILPSTAASMTAKPRRSR